MVDLPLQDDEQEEQPQQDVPQVAEDVVESARRAHRTQAQPLPVQAGAQSLPLQVPHRPGRGLPRRSPPEVAQRVGAEEVVVADVLIPCDIHHLQAGEGRVPSSAPCPGEEEPGASRGRPTPLCHGQEVPKASRYVHRYPRPSSLWQPLSTLSGVADPWV